MRKFFQKAVAGLTLLAMIQIPGPYDWTTYQKDTSRSSFVDDNVSGGVKLGWSKSTENSFDIPLFQDGIYYFTEKQAEGFTVYAVNKEDGSELWRYNGSGSLNGSIEVYQDWVFIPGSSLVCLDSYTGEINWQKDGGGNVFRYPMPNENLLYVWSASNLHAIDINTGINKWIHFFPGVQESTHLTATPYGDAICVYYGTDGQTHINYISAGDGNGSSVSIPGKMISPLILNAYDLGFIALESGKIAIVDPYEMIIIRELDFGDRVSAPASYADTIYFLSNNILSQELSLNSLSTEIDYGSESGPYIIQSDKKTVGSLPLPGEMPEIFMVGDKLFFKGAANEVWQTSFMDGLKKHKIGGISGIDKIINADHEFIVLGSDKKKIIAFTLDPSIAPSDVVISSPYKTGSQYSQYVGQLHSHYIPDIKIPGQRIRPEYTVQKYKDAGYDFVALTEHNQLVSNPGVDGITFIENSEEDTQGHYGNHILAVGIKNGINENLSDQERINQVTSQGGFASLAHPNSYYYQWKLNELFEMQDYNAIEIYNTGIDKAGKYFDLITREDLNPYDNSYSLDKWDQLLSKRKRVFATAGDDFTPNNPGFDNAAVAVFAKDNSQTAILESLKSGNFYLMQGTDSPRLNIGVSESVTVSSSETANFKFIGKEGKVLKEEGGISNASYTPKGDEIYVRVEVTDKDNNVSWTQPVFVDQPKESIATGGGAKSIDLEEASLQADTGTDLKMSTLNSDEFPAVAPRWGYLSNIFDLSTNGSVNGQAALSIGYDPEDLLIGEDNLSIFSFDAIGNVWKKVVSSVDKINKKVTAQLDHFSLYALSSDLQSDKIAPSLEIANARDLSEVSGETDIMINSTDNNKTYNVSGYLDKSILLFSDSDPSDGFGNAVDFSAYPAGRHTLRVIATDSFGNKTEKELKIKNTSNNEKPQIKITSSSRNKKLCSGFKASVASKGSTSSKTGLIYLDNQLLGEVDLSDSRQKYTFPAGDAKASYNVDIMALPGHHKMKRMIKIIKSCTESKKKWLRIVSF